MILSNTEFINCIDSDSIKSYYQSNRIDVIPQVIFSLIYHCDKPLSVKINAMKKLAIYCSNNQCKETDEVIIQANKFCERMTRYTKDFQSQKSNDIYKLSAQEDGDNISNLFPSFTSAINYIMNHKDSIKGYIEIDKIRMDPNDTDMLIGTVYMHINSTSLETIDIWMNGSLYSDDENDRLFENNDPIEDRYYTIYSPFKAGDIVKLVGTRFASDNYILFVSDRNNYPRCPIRDEGFPSAYDECGLSLDAYDRETGEITYYDIGCVSPFHLEYDNRFKEYEYGGSTENNAIVSYSDLLKGKLRAPYAMESILRNYAAIHHIPNSLTL